MQFAELFVTAIALSLDAFAAAICKSLTIKKPSLKDALIIGGYFGVFQALMPILGYIAGSSFASHIEQWDHWIAFVLLSLIGANMLYEGIKNKGCDIKCSSNGQLSYKAMLPLAIGTSIDALVVGVTFSFLDVKILPSSLFIGLTTMALSVLAVLAAKSFSAKLKSRSELLGGIILILLGIRILVSHLQL